MGRDTRLEWEGGDEKGKEKPGWLREIGPKELREYGNGFLISRI
jgi:hypothetical protein